MPLSVLVLSYLFPNRAQPAYGIFVLNRLKAVQKHCSIKVIAPVQWYPLIRRVRGALWGSTIPSRDEIDGIEVHHPRFLVIPRFFKWIDGITYWWSARAVLRQLTKVPGYHYDLIDVHWTYPDIIAGYLLARTSGKRFIVTVRGHEALYDDERSIRRWLVAYFMRRADFVITLSAELRAKVVQLGVPRERTRVVLNGVDLSRFRPMDRDACRKQLGLPAGRKILLSVGRVTAGKGHQDLVRMMPELSRTDDVELYIIGGVNPEHDFTDTLRTMIADLHLKNVHLLDGVPHETLRLWYCAADVFCLASKREGCPNVLLEALACGTPAVTMDVGAAGEAVVDGENGLLVQPERIASLAGIVRSSLTRSWDREKIAAGMRRRGWSACAEQVVEIYRSVLAMG
jgi:glycosyltransferase involved in cell wall biosynthesis